MYKSRAVTSIEEEEATASSISAQTCGAAYLIWHDKIVVWAIDCLLSSKFLVTALKCVKVHGVKVHGVKVHGVKVAWCEGAWCEGAWCEGAWHGVKVHGVKVHGVKVHGVKVHGES